MKQVTNMKRKTSGCDLSINSHREQNSEVQHMRFTMCTACTSDVNDKAPAGAAACTDRFHNITSLTVTWRGIVYRFVLFCMWLLVNPVWELQYGARYPYLPLALN